MSVRSIFVTGLARVLGTYWLGDAAGKAAVRAVIVIEQHLTLDGRDLAAAFRDSQGRGAGTITLGISPEGKGSLTRLTQKTTA